MHTKGPWEVGTYGNHDLEIQGGNRQIAILKRLGNTDTEEGDNARLIAASPELLAAAKALLKWVETQNSPFRACPVCGAGTTEQHNENCAIVLGRAAIQKAEGVKK